MGTGLDAYLEFTLIPRLLLFPRVHRCRVNSLIAYIFVGHQWQEYMRAYHSNVEFHSHTYALCAESTPKPPVAKGALSLFCRYAQQPECEAYLFVLRIPFRTGVLMTSCLDFNHS